MSDSQETTEKNWFYEEKGQRKGPVSEAQMVQFIKASVISHDTSVWKQGFPGWLKIENTDLRAHIDTTVPPPLSGEDVNNTLVWVLAFAPLIGHILELFVAGAMNNGNELRAQAAMMNNKYIFITIGLYIALSFFDEKHLKNAGHNTSKFKGWTWLVPVYLYKRAKATQQNMAYLIVWVACVILTPLLFAKL